MSYILQVEAEFAAAHQLRGYKGKCENLHGHNWRVRLMVEGDRLDECGMLVDFGVLKKLLSEALAKLDHMFLNDVAPFDKENPTSENIARFLATTISLPEGIVVHSVTVWESERCAATYLPPKRG